MVSNVLANYFVRCSSLFWKNIWKLCAAKPAKKWRTSCCWPEMNLSLPRMHATNSSRKWRLLIKNAKTGKSDLTLSTNVQYVEDFRFWMNVTGHTHRLPDKEIAKYYVSRLKTDVFREEMYSRTFETLEYVIREAREELSTYRDIWKYLIVLKNWNLIRNFFNPRKDFPIAVSNF